MMKRYCLLLALCLWPVLFACTASQDIALEPDGSGTASMRIEIHPLYMEYFESAAQSAGSKGKPGQVFDPARIKERMEKRPGVRVTRIASPSPEKLEVDISFTDIRKLLTDRDPERSGAIIGLKDEGGVGTLAFHLDRKNARQLASLFGDMTNPAFRELSPRAKRTKSEKEYLEAIDFLVGADGVAAIRAASVRVTVRTSGELTGQSGGAIENGRAVFQVPLLRLMLLDKPLDYAVTFSTARKKKQK